MGWRDRLFGPRGGTQRQSQTDYVVSMGGPLIQGEGAPNSQVREGLKNFDRVDMSVMCDVSVRVGTPAPTHDLRVDGTNGHPFRAPPPGDTTPGYRVTVTVQENLQSVIHTMVRGRTLHIESDGSYRSTAKMHIEIEMPKLVGLSSSGQGAMHVDGVHGDSFTLDHSGMSNVVVRGHVGHLAADLSGNGDVTLDGFVTERTVLNHGGLGSLHLRGRTESLVALLSGHGSIDLSECPTPWLHLMASGMGSIQVHCTKSAKGLISSMGSVRVHGKPTDWSVRHDGMGEVNFV